METLKKEKFVRPMSGYVMLAVALAMIAFFIYNVSVNNHLVWLMIVSGVVLLVSFIIMAGFLVVNPNE